MSESKINYNAYRILQNANNRRNGMKEFPSKEITSALKRLGFRRTPGTNGEGEYIEVAVNGTSYKVLAIRIKS